MESNNSGRVLPKIGWRQSCRARLSGRCHHCYVKYGGSHAGIDLEKAVRQVVKYRAGLCSWGNVDGQLHQFDFARDCYWRNLASDDWNGVRSLHAGFGRQAAAPRSLADRSRRTPIQSIRSGLVIYYCDHFAQYAGRLGGGRGIWVRGFEQCFDDHASHWPPKYP